MHSAVEYGIWNGMTKRFVFGIRAGTKQEAQKMLVEKAGKGAYCWRYEARIIPAGFKNPPNDRYKNGGHHD